MSSKIKCLIKSLPGIRKCYVLFQDTVEFYRIKSLRHKLSKPVDWNDETNIIISLTTFPARINGSWIAIESLFQQKFRPWKIVLVLSLEEFPDKVLPNEIRIQIARGLEVLWVERNTKSFKKLLPTREKYPEAIIVTADDDMYYIPSFLGDLIKASSSKPGVIVGHRGWVISSKKGQLQPYNAWAPACDQTASNRCFLTSGGGILFPPYVLPLSLLLDIDLAMKLCPNADDIWFWAISYKTGAPSFCTGKKAIIPIRGLRDTPSLYSINDGDKLNDSQLENVIKYFKLQLWPE